MQEPDADADADLHPIVTVEAGGPRIAIWSSEDWDKAYVGLLPIAQYLLERYGYLSFVDAHDVIIHGYFRFVTMDNPEIRPTRGCYWHYKHHVKYGFKDVLSQHIKEKERAVYLEEIDNSDFRTYGPALAWINDNTPETYTQQIEFNRRIASLASVISKKSGHTDHMMAVLEALLIDDVGTGGSSISNMKLSESADLSVSQAVAAKRRLQRLGASND